MVPGDAILSGLAAETFPGLSGKWTVCSIDLDLLRPNEIAFAINLDVWNQYEVYQSRHVPFYLFKQFDLADDLQLDIDNIFTPKWHFTASAPQPIWSIFYQTIGSSAWGANVWQPPSP